MARIVEILKTYRYFNRKRHRVEVFEPGTYKIPDEISNESAENAYFVGLGRILIVVPPQVEKPKADVADVNSGPASDASQAPGVSPKRKRKSRKRSPEDKSLGLAPENKSGLG